MIEQNLKKIRESKGISQDKLSKLANVSLNTIAKLETGESKNPTIKTLRAVASALQVPLSDLLK